MIAAAFDLIAELLEYPTDRYHERLREVLAAPPRMKTGAADQLAAFAKAVTVRSLPELEELYIQTFDLNPDATLDIGWHLFGEDYARGDFLVRLRQEMRRYGLADRNELPDSLLTVLPLAARMPEEDATQFRKRFVLPAVEKIRKAVPPEGNPFGHLLAALALLLDDRTKEERQ
jgi:nitrate reductase delta subunit